MGYKTMLAGQLLKTAGGKIKTGILNTKDNVSDYVAEKREQSQETQRLIRQGQEMYQEACSRNYACQEMLKQESAWFYQQVEHINARLFHTYQCVCTYVDTQYLENVVDKKSMELPSQQIAYGSKMDYTPLKAVTGGLMSAGAAIGVVTAIGTAGTGTAISSLSGAAYISSMLACMGGGTLAAGGLGVTGGLAVLGATAVIPAAAIGAYGLDKKITQDYQQATQYYNEVQVFTAKVNEAWQNAMAICNAYKELSMSTSSFGQFFSDMLNMSSGAIGMGEGESFQPLLNEAALILHGYINIPILKDNIFYDGFTRELKELNIRAGECRHSFYQYFISLSSEQQDFMESCRQDDFAHRLAEAKTYMEGKFGSSWKQLQANTQTFLVTGGAFFEQMSAIRQSMDYSGVCFMLGKAMEVELKKRLFKGFCQYVESQRPMALYASDWPKILCGRSASGTPCLRADGQITLGALAYICCGKYGDDVSAASQHMKWLSSYGRSVLFNQILSDREVQELFAYMGKFIHHVADTYRNPSAHNQIISYSKALECLNYILEQEKGFPWIMKCFRK